MMELSQFLNNLSFVLPSRTNLKYLKGAYKSIRENVGPEPWICFGDDASIDSTFEWMEEIKEKDPKIKMLRNQGPERWGLVKMYNKITDELVSTDYAIIFHADMVILPNAFDEVIKYIKPGTIVSLTRLEPSLHPPGPEKIILDCGLEPEEFDYDKLIEWYHTEGVKSKNKTTEGIFCPWIFYKKDFMDIGMHDNISFKQSKDDTDIFNRFQLNGVKFVQVWGGFVYHYTSRGSRFNPSLTTPGVNSNEWEIQNEISTRNFIRKWGHFCKHDKYMKPIIPHKYDIGFKVTNCNSQLFHALEPWCGSIFGSFSEQMVNDYLEKEQPNTPINLKEKINPDKNPNILVEFDCNNLTQDTFNILTKLPEIINDSGEVGSFELGHFKIAINSLDTYEDDLIICKENQYVSLNETIKT